MHLVLLVSCSPLLGPVRWPAGHQGPTLFASAGLGAEILGNRYQGRIPLPRIPTYQGTNIAAPKTVETPAGQIKAALAMHMLNGDAHVSQRTILETHANRISEPIIFVGS